MDKQEFKEKAKKGIDDIFIKIDELEAKKDIVKNEAKEKYHKQIEEMKEKKNDLREKYDHLMLSADEKWEDTKIAFSKAFDSFKKGLMEIGDLFKEQK